ncbi:MAG: aminopeptidase P family protein [Bacteroidetes bacterium SB0662_bin_6]|nr:aminopeptidase P family protein [Bacteroidetes bacterium SB0668_bin_1]MYE04951.1 aminopeptidase P family protein [Bacteroidetes bacterium SB0662_bin_6]
MSESPFPARQCALARELARLDLHALAVVPGASLMYLTGLDFHLSERPTVAFFRQHGAPVFVIPELEEGKLGGFPMDICVCTYGEDPSIWPEAFREASRAGGLDGQRIGIEPGSMRVLELRMLRETMPESAYPDGHEALAALRICKDAHEIEKMRSAVQVAEDAMRRLLSTIAPGITEREAASRLTARLLDTGCAPEIPFPPIVAFGPSSANPHAAPGDRALRSGELILCDWGANVEGYFSDMTRMFAYGDPGNDARHIVEVVARARQAAAQAAGPGVPVSEVDRAARAVIEKAGFGERFVHRTGHGVGLEIHEAPYIRDGNPMLLRPGMTFTIEPGIYLDGVAGARIEDIVAVTEDGVDTLTTLPRELVDISAR